MKNDSGSFRDPSGHVYIRSGKLFRQINRSYFTQFEYLTKSGLYKELISHNLLVGHQVISRTKESIIIRPQKIPFISYPYEWSFDMLRDAALLTLKIQKISLNHGMVLKDASAFNIQFIGSRPIFIDTLSFEKYREGETWIAYKQFCQHFLAPLALMSIKDLRMNLLLREYIDGIPIDLASKLMPLSSWFNISLLLHLHLHSNYQKRLADKKINTRRFQMSKFQMTSLIQNLENSVQSLGIGKISTEWDKYYSFTNYSDKAFNDKRRIVGRFLQESKAGSVLDLGANNGEFSHIPANQNISTIACDIDSLAVNKCYLQHRNNLNLLPLVIDLTNPSPGLGWAHTERSSFTARFHSDLVMALALIHHLSISNNLPFDTIAGYLSKLGKFLIIEFIPKEDSKVQLLLQNRTDIFQNYSQNVFENVFRKYFNIVNFQKISDSKRTIYLMERK